VSSDRALDDGRPIRDSILRVVGVVRQIEGAILGGQPVDLAPLSNAASDLHRQATDGSDSRSLSETEKTALGEIILEIERMTQRLAITIREAAGAAEAHRRGAEAAIEYEKYRIG
jgi:hypothetical protein